MILIAITVPVILYAVLCWRRWEVVPVQNPGPRQCVVAAAGAIVLVAGWAVVYGTPWQGSTQIAWVALQSNGPSLSIGGDRDSRSIGWPTRAFAPAVRLRSDQGCCSIISSGGSGFLQQGDHYLNGLPIATGRNLNSGGMHVRLESTSHRLGLSKIRELVVETAQNEELARVEIRQPGRDRVLSGETLFNDSSIRLRQAGQSSAARTLEQWAVGLKVMASASGQVLLLDGGEFISHVTAGEPVKLQWNAASLTFRVFNDTTGMGVMFDAPWRWSSPVPPASNGGTVVRMTASAMPRPGEIAMQLPLGRADAEFRQEVTFSGTTFHSGLAPRNPDSTLSPLPGPRNGLEFKRLTSRVAVALPQWTLTLATLDDLPRPQWVAASLLLALGLLCLALWRAVGPVQNPSGDPIRRVSECDEWVVCGLALAFFALLAVRLLLAFRYAADPSYLDQLAVDGVRRAVVALTVCPGLILLAVPLWRDAQRPFKLIPAVASAASRGIFQVFAGLMAGLLVAVKLSNQLWPNLPQAYQGQQWQLWLILPMACGACALYLMGTSAPPGEWARLERMSVRLERDVMRLFHSLAGRRGAALWDSTLGRRQPGARQSEESVQRAREFRHQVGAAIRLVVLTLLAVMVLHPLVPPSLKVFQDAVAPLLLAWAPVCLLLASRTRILPDRGTEPGWRAAFGSDVRWGRVFAISAVLLTVTVFCTPLAVHDPGGIMATTAVFLSVLFVLLAGRRPWGVPLQVLLLVAAAIGLALVVYLNPEPVASHAGLTGHGIERVLVFRGSSSAQRDMGWLSARGQDGPVPVSAAGVRDAIEHVWENQAIAHVGGWFGLGFTRAPVRNSQVRQDTIQFDSTYSFYIAAEHGLAGGIALLLLYAVPMVFLFRSSRKVFDTGHGLAMTIAGALLLEAAFHVLMNYGAMPFTGRDLPLMAVNSRTDLLRWMLLFALAVQAVLWRSEAGPGTQPVVSLISPPPRSIEEDDGEYRRAGAWLAVLPAAVLLSAAWAGNANMGDRSLESPFDWSGLLSYIGQLCESGDLRYDPHDKRVVARWANPVLGKTLLEDEILRFNALSDEEKLEGVGSPGAREYIDSIRRLTSVTGWDNLMSRLRLRAVERNRIMHPSLFRLVPPAGWTREQVAAATLDDPLRLRPNPARNSAVSFHTLPPGDLPSIGFRGSNGRSRVLRGDDFELLLSQASGSREEVVLQEFDSGTLRAIQPGSGNVHELRVKIRFRPTGSTALQTQEFGVFNLGAEGLTFQAGPLGSSVQRGWRFWKSSMKPGEKTALNEGDRVFITSAARPDWHPLFTTAESALGALAGPAWVRGVFVPTEDPNAPLPWARQLSIALPSERRRGGVGSTAELSSLTLDRDWQVEAQRFAAVWGRQLHRELLARRPDHDVLPLAQALIYALPPRVALSVVEVPSGEVLALGGWPHTSTDTYWRNNAGEWLPSEEWMRQYAPRSLRERFLGERNFDRLLMGSTTKPIWAASVLSLYPDLASQLAVRALSVDDLQDDDVFGIPVTPGWRLSHPPHGLNSNPWCDFNSYLALSDNRYHTRLGFLGIASPALGFAAGQSDSARESLDGGASPWRHVPAFPGLQFSRRNPRELRHLENTMLAHQLAQMFGIGILDGERLLRRSFWSGDEEDDVRVRGGSGWAYKTAGPSPRLDAISPEAPDFELEKVTSPREFVTLLMGGGANLWANVDFAGAFGTAITGTPIVPHIIRRPAKAADRALPVETPGLLRPGLHAVLESGTAWAPFRTYHGADALALLPGVEAYAKTGTLSDSDAVPDTSRIVVALIRRRDGGVEAGLVLSLVLERARMGQASEFMAQYLWDHRDQLRGYFAAQPRTGR